MHSYSLERSRGLDGHNIITAVMKEHHLDLQQALYWISGYTSKIISNFLTNYHALPSWGEEIDGVVRVYIDRVAWCVRGCDAWSYVPAMVHDSAHTPRYELPTVTRSCRMVERIYRPRTVWRIVDSGDGSFRKAVASIGRKLRLAYRHQRHSGRLVTWRAFQPN